MRRFRVDHLVNADEETFKKELSRLTESTDDASADEKGAPLIRPASTSFQWATDHDFGSFQVQGFLGDRHIRLIAEFIDEFQVIGTDLDGLRVLDIGCWTGGTSLLLSAMGAQVLAIEEVNRYVEWMQYVKHAFAIDNLEVRQSSLYELTDSEFQDAFDLVLFVGVLYHVTDPILALRTTFNCLKDGGLCLLETTGFRARRPLVSFQRRRWNWFDLSRPALAQMMADVGYQECRIGKILSGRMYAVGRRQAHERMRRDGLSIPSIR
jgi:2-polyprenyl-3-methyl-5-hydroxy-6-metoxy-1,4-benzoquinol methylase